MPFNIGPLELLLVLMALGAAVVVVRVGIRRLRGSRNTEQLEDLQDKVELLEYQLQEERQLEERQLKG